MKFTLNSEHVYGMLLDADAWPGAEELVVSTAKRLRISPVKPGRRTAIAIRTGDGVFDLTEVGEALLAENPAGGWT